MAIRVQKSGGAVEVFISGLERLLAIKAKLDIPLGNIVSVEVMPRRAVPRAPGTWLRIPGSYIPFLARYGSYGLAPNREFWATHARQDVVVITVDDWAYRRVVLGTRDPQAVQATILI